MHTYIPTYLPTCIHTYLPTYIPTYMQVHCKDSAAVATNNFHAGTLALLMAVATMTFSQVGR